MSTPSFFSCVARPARAMVSFAPVAIAVLTLGLFHSAFAANQVVTSVADTGVGSLRQAVLDVGVNETITFATALNGQTIFLSSRIDIAKNLRIDGAALSDGIAINGGNSTQIFYVNAATVTFSKLTIRNAKASNGGAGLNGPNADCDLFSGHSAGDGSPGTAGFSGGAIYNTGNLTLEFCTLLNNAAGNGGQGGRGGSGCFLYPYEGRGGTGGTGGLGGAIYNAATGTLNLQSCTFASNRAGLGGTGGAGGTSLYSAAGGPGGSGGAIYNVGVLLTVKSSTFSLNASGSGGLPGGGIAPFGANGTGGGIFTSGTTGFQDNLIAENTSSASSGHDVQGSVTSSGNNLIGVVDGSAGWSAPSGDLLGSLESPLDPILNALGDYGGPTQTMPPQRGSPALDSASSAGLTIDQRGFARPSGSAVDIGAVEANFDMVVTSLNDAGAGSLREAVSLATLPDTRITFDTGLNGGTIILSGSPIQISGDLEIDASTLTNGLTISANALSRVLEVTTGAVVVMDSLTITRGNSAAGAGLLNQGNLTIKNSTFTANGGGAIYNLNGNLTLNNSTIAGNSIGNNGGGILNNAATLILNHSTVSGNTAGLAGGGIAHLSGSVTLNNSIVAGNTAASDPNVSGSFSAVDSITSGDPLLAPLGDYGGSTATMPPLFGSPAIDTALSSVLTTDQRGFARPVGLARDLGAVEAVIATVSPSEATAGLSLLPQLTWSGASGASFELFFGTAQPSFLKARRFRRFSQVHRC